MKRINVTQSFLPPIEEYEQYLKKIWESGQLTNQGPLVSALESELEAYLGVEGLQIVSNGTSALQIALKALDISEGEIITTPFTYIATTAAILWERCTPVYIDIDPTTLCIDADKIEEAITDKTKAIMAVHVFGRPCNVVKIEDIAKRHKLKVIYDAAHAFGVEYNGRSLLGYGDISICSFHSTKLFHTVEGGCLVTKEADLASKIDLIKRFGHNGDDHKTLGLNAKLSEFHAAMGLCNIKHIRSIIDGRKRVTQLYDTHLHKGIVALKGQKEVSYNFAYYPVVFRDELELEQVVNALNDKNVFPRRYFWPSINKIEYVGSKKNCPISEDIASRILCLPLYPNLETVDVIRIANIVNGVMT